MGGQHLLHHALRNAHLGQQHHRPAAAQSGLPVHRSLSQPGDHLRRCGVCGRGSGIQPRKLDLELRRWHHRHPDQCWERDPQLRRAGGIHRQPLRPGQQRVRFAQPSALAGAGEHDSAVQQLPEHAGLRGQSRFCGREPRAKCDVDGASPTSRGRGDLSR